MPASLVVIPYIDHSGAFGVFRPISVDDNDDKNSRLASFEFGMNHSKEMYIE